MFKSIDQIERIIQGLGSASGFATMVILLIVCIDVVGRSFFNAPLDAGVEASELMLVSLVFLGLAAAQQRKQNFAIDILYNNLPGVAQKGLDVIGFIVCLAITVTMAWPSTMQAISSFQRNEMGFSLVAFPIWPARIVIAGGLWLLALQFTFDLLRIVLNRPRALDETTLAEGFAE